MAQIYNFDQNAFNLTFLSQMSTNISEYLENMKNIQINILSFIENEGNNEENFQNLMQLFENHKILDNAYTQN